MASNLSFLNQWNGYLPKLSGQVISFMQMVDDFPINRYCQFVMTPTMNASYQLLGRDESVRVTGVDLDVFEDGQARPKGFDALITHDMIPYRTQRRSRQTTIGHLAIEQCEGWKPKPTHTNALLSQTMTAMTQRVATVLTTAANWSGATADATVLNGGAGNWANSSADPASSQYNAIWKTITAVLLRIKLLTNNRVKLSDLRFIVNPVLAVKMSQTPEMVEYCRSSPDAKSILEKGLDDQFNACGLPKSYKGTSFIVEDTPIVVSKRSVDTNGVVQEETVTDPSNDSANRRFIYPKDKCIVVSRVGALEGEASGSPNFSTMQIYYYKERLKTLGLNDVWNQVFQIAVEINQQEVLAAPVSGYEITSCM